eukprot:scaffold4204_cov329-Prasinococcus_capsulatus_cf.AAC.3
MLTSSVAPPGVVTTLATGGAPAAPGRAFARALARDGPCNTLALCDRASRWAPATPCDGRRLPPVLGAGRPSVLAGGASSSSSTVLQRHTTRSTMAIGGEAMRMLHAVRDWRGAHSARLACYRMPLAER